MQFKSSFFENIGYPTQQPKSHGFRLKGESMPGCKNQKATTNRKKQNREESSKN